MMKKINLLFSALLFIAGTAYSQKQYRLNSIESNDIYDKFIFNYDNDTRLKWYDLTTTNGITNLEFREELLYDDNGNLDIINKYKWLNNEWNHYCIVEFDYNADNKRISRTDYRILGGVFEKQDVYTYTYDDEGKLVHHDLELGGIPLERCDYSYENGMPKEELYEGYDHLTDTWELSSLVTYRHDDGNLTNIDYAWWDGIGWKFDNSIVMTYDNRGNCLSRSYRMGDNVSDRISYEYDMEVEMEHINMPVLPEPAYGWFDQFVNLPLKYSWERVDADGVLQYVCDFNFNYEELGTSSTKAYSDNASVNIFPNPASDFITVRSDRMQAVEVVDVNGNVVRRLISSGDDMEIDVRNLSAGVYVVKVLADGGWVSLKVFLSK